MDTHCPLCKTELNEGATVCHGCGAMLTTRGQAQETSTGSAVVVLACVVMWLFCGPISFGLLIHTGEIFTEIQRALIHVIITAVGLLVAYKYGLKMNEPVWVRRQ
jgi:predicted nucleic acid-binding Zn ribbon protein